ncbi:MAG: twin-arginine translocase subunit TatC [Phycisphaeraceae bacterium]|nr:twin-arginine translocase subunit TatC [Phycisphaerales bacterium]MCB9859376.1 twin-arginine translocase subunit TatC [Phycisphaeraceae bacterium]
MAASLGKKHKTKPRPRSADDGRVMPLGDHLEELRIRLILGILGLVPILVVAIIFGKSILAWLLVPAQTQLADAGLPPYLQATSPLETFWAYFKIAFVTAIIIGAPWILWQLWKFIAPGLHRSEQRFVYLLAPLSGILTIMSVLFLYYIMLPVVMQFFISFGITVVDFPVEKTHVPFDMVFPSIPMLPGDPSDPVPGTMWVDTVLHQLRFAMPDGSVLGTPLTKATGVLQQYRVSEYLNMVLMMAMGFALGFQLPVIVLLLGWTGIAEPSFLKKYRRHIALILAIVGAALTPADPVSMFLLAVPMYILFEFGLVLLIILPAQRVSKGFSSESKETEGYDEPDLPSDYQNRDTQHGDLP